MVDDPKPPEKTPDAPWGYKKDGTPYKRNPAQYTARGTKASAAQRHPEVEKAERAQRVYEFLSIPVGVAGMVGQATGSKALVADAVTLGQGAPVLAKGVADVASENEAFAEIVDKLTASGPYAALFGALAPIVVQIAANHSERVAKVAVASGVAKSVDEVLASAMVPADPGPAAAAGESSHGADDVPA